MKKRPTSNLSELLLKITEFTEKPIILSIPLRKTNKQVDKKPAAEETFGKGQRVLN